jgi:hypothetical protein
VSSRERKRNDRRKRKQRSAGAEPAVAAEELATTNGHATGAAGPADDDVADIAAEAERRGVPKSEIRNERVREGLEPLAEGERPTVVTAGAILSFAIALITVGAYIAGAEVDGERPNAVQVFAPAILFGVMGYGMWRVRYWAVLGFQAVMGILMVGAFLSLIAAASVLAALTAVFILAGAGTFFWFTVKAMARIQMPDKHLPK